MKKIIVLIIKLAIIIPAALLLADCFVRVNAGTLIGCIIFGGIILATVFSKPLWKAVKWLWERLWGKFTLVLTAVLAAVCVFAVTFFSVNMVDCMYKPLDRVDVVIVLGCRVRGDVPSSLLSSRCAAAAEVLNEHHEAVCIVAGGQGDGENITEAEAMYRLLTEWGISPDRIYKEEKSTSTVENFEFSAEIMQREGVTGNVAVITSEYHQYRASLYAKRAGLGETGHYSGSTMQMFLLNYWLREWAALAALFVFGY